MSSKTHKEAKTHYGLVVSVSYATVDAFLVEYSLNEKPKVIVHKGSHVPGLFSGIETSLLEREILSLETLGRVLHEMLPEVHTYAPKKAVCLLGEPWILSSVRTVTISKKQPVAVTHALLDKALESDYRGMIASLQKEHGDVEDLEVVDRKVLHVEIDGYPVANPIGKKGTTIAQQLYVSLAPLAIKEKIQELVQSVFPAVTLEFTSEQFLTWFATASLFDQPFSLLRIGYDVIDIIVVDKQSGIRAIGHVPYGTREWYSTCASLVGIAHPRHIRSLIHLYATERLNAKSERHVEHTLRLLSKSAGRSCDQLFGMVLEQSLLPQNIILFSDSLWEPFLTRMLAENHVLKETLGFPPKIHTAHTLPAHNAVVWNDGKPHAYWSNVLSSVGTLFYERS